MTNPIIRLPDAPLTEPRTMQDAAQVADHYAALGVFADYQNRKSANTLRAQGADLATFAAYLCQSGIIGCPSADDLQNYPDNWQGISHGLVSGFAKWMLGQGMALTSLNRKLSTVKVYAGLASAAGVIPGAALSLITTVKGYSQKEFTKVDEKRTQTRQTTRVVDGKVRQTTKKAKATTISKEQAKLLKTQPDTAQGRRDAVIMTLLLDHGLRVGELVALQITDLNLATKELVFFRSKVQKTQTHTLTADALRALKAYVTSGDAPAMGPLLRRSVKGGSLGASGLTELGVNLRVGQLGAAIGLDGLGPHDCRHYWATKAIKNKTNPFALMQAGGWTSMQTVQKYVDENKIANAGVNAED